MRMIKLPLAQRNMIVVTKIDDQSVAHSEILVDLRIEILAVVDMIDFCSERQVILQSLL